MAGIVGAQRGEIMENAGKAVLPYSSTFGRNDRVPSHPVRLPFLPACLTVSPPAVHAAEWGIAPSSPCRT